MEITTFFVYLFVMAGVTYLVRAVPFLLVKNKSENSDISAFLEYIPYAVLTSMTIPAIFVATGSVVASTAGFVTALFMAYFERSLIEVALGASFMVFLSRLLLSLM